MHRNTPTTVAPDAPIMQWANAHTKQKANGRQQPLVGFHIEKGRDDALDAMLAELGYPQVDIVHQRESAPAELKTHWYFGGDNAPIQFYPITGGPPATTISGCRSARFAQATIDAGLGLAWPQGQRSKFAVRGFLTLVDDSPLLVQLSVRSTMSEYLLAALLDHVRVATVADNLIDRERHPEIVCLHELALPLLAGEESTVGSQQTAQIVPLRSGHPHEIDAAYIKTIWRSKHLDDAARDAWADVLAWAQSFGVEEPVRGVAEPPAEYSY